VRPDTLRGWINRAPFRHFRLHLTTGVAFEVRHPEEVAVQGDRVILTLGGAGGAGPPRQIDISLLHIVYIEMIPPAPSPSAN
jgi:hypothetical protein